MPVERYRLQPLPKIPVLKTESVDEYLKLRREVEAALDSSDAIEQLYVDDIVNHQWEIARLRRTKATLINMKLRSALTKMIMRIKVKSGEVPAPFDMRTLDQRVVIAKGQSPIGFTQDYLDAREAAEGLSRRWFTDAKAREEVAALLRQFNFDESAVEAEAIRKLADELDILDRMLTSLESRRNKALVYLAGYRESVLVQPRARADRVLERKSSLDGPSTKN